MTRLTYKIRKPAEVMQSEPVTPRHEAGGLWAGTPDQTLSKKMRNRREPSEPQIEDSIKETMRDRFRKVGENIRTTPSRIKDNLSTAWSRLKSI